MLLNAVASLPCAETPRPRPSSTSGVYAACMKLREAVAARAGLDPAQALALGLLRFRLERDPRVLLGELGQPARIGQSDTDAEKGPGHRVLEEIGVEQGVEDQRQERQAHPEPGDNFALNLCAHRNTRFFLFLFFLSLHFRPPQAFLS